MALKPVTIRLLGESQSAESAVNKTKSAISSLAVESKSAAVDVASVGKATENINSTGFDVASRRAAFLKENLEGVRNAGLIVAGIGAGGLMITGQLANAANEGERATENMADMLRKIGETDAAISGMQDWAGKLAFDAALPDDDPLKEAAAGMAGFGISAEKIQGLMPGIIGQTRLYNTSLDGVSEAVGRAFAKGDLDGLARQGVVLTEEQKARMKALEDAGASMAEKQAAMYDILRESFDKYAFAITEGLSEGEKAANRQALALDNVQTALGTGATNAKQQMDSMGAAILNLVSSNPKLAEGAGYMFAWGSYAAAGVGGIVAFAAQIASLLGDGAKYIDFIKGLRAQKAALATATAISATAAGVEGGAIATAGTASALAGGGAATGAIGFGALAASIWAAVAPLLVFVAIALAAAAAMWGLDKAMHSVEDAENAANIERGNATNQARLDDINRERRKRGLRDVTVEEFQRMESDEEGVYSPEQASSKPVAFKSGSDATGGMPDMAELQKMVSEAQTKSPTVAAPSPPMTLTALPSVSVGSAATTATGADGDDPYAAQLISLQRQKRDLKGKENAAQRDAIQKQIDNAQDAQRAWKKQHAGAVKAGNEAEREAKAKEKRDEADARMLDKIDSDARTEDKILALQEQLDKAKEDKNAAQVRAITLQIAKLKADQEYNEAIINARDEEDAGHRSALELAAKKRREIANRRAVRDAEKAVDSLSKGGSGDKDARSAELRARLAFQQTGGPLLGRVVGSDIGGDFRTMVSQPMPDLSGPRAPRRGPSSGDDGVSANPTSLERRGGKNIATVQLEWPDRSLGSLRGRGRRV